MREVKLLYSSPPAVKGGRYGHLKPARHAIFVVLLLVFNSPASDLLSGTFFSVRACWSAALVLYCILVIMSS